MDLTNLNTKTGAEKGAFLHLRHPALGHKMYTGPGADAHGVLIDSSKDHTEVGVTVRGTESETFKQHIAASARSQLISSAEKASLGKGGNQSPNHIPTEDELRRNQAKAEVETMEMVCLLVIEFHGITMNGEPLSADEDGKRAFFGQSKDLLDQVVRFSEDRANFFGAALSG